MTPQQAVSYIENYGWSTTRLGLERTFALLEKLGDPQKKLKFIHVAGSNGKGSTCAMLDAILRAAGYRTGLYTSPYIQEFCERIRINGENIPGSRLAELTERIYEIAETMEDHPSQFELVTAIAMEYFYQEHCDIVVLEVGMGGLLDSTNVIDAPELAVIANIGLEHTEYLGSTLAEIAAAKAGIIKSGCRCVCYDGAEEVTEVICRVCKEKNVPLTCVDFGKMTGLHQDLNGQDIVWCGKEYHLHLIGEHQKHNAALVLTGIEILRDIGWNIPEHAVREGLATVSWPARLEVLHRHPVFLLDGGHNPQCAKALTESLNVLLPGKKVTFLVGVLEDKDYDTILRMLLPYAGEFICVTPLNGRALPGTDLQLYLEKLGAHALACDSIEEGIIRALDCAGKDGCVVAFGSLYMAGAVRTLFRGALRKRLRKTGIHNRNDLPDDMRQMLSAQAVERLVQTAAFQQAKTVLIYEHTKHELSLDALKQYPQAAGKRFVWPMCINDTEMAALLPHGEDAWKIGYCGIREPVPEESDLIAPEDIDLVVCPCTAFDEDGHRMGMGGGFYDRYLPKCTNAAICAMAFEAQKAPAVDVDSWDVPMDFVVTERAVYKGLPPKWD